MDEEILTAETDEDDKSEKSVSSDLIRGHINTIILRSLYDGDKYGYEIIAEIERKSSGQYSLKQPSLYSALKRLEKDGYITSYWGGSVGGGRRKYFSLTDEGKAVSEQNQAEWEYSRTIIDSLISDRDFDFNNPAPTAVDMRVLKRSTSRVPSGGSGEDDGEEFVFEPAFDDTSLREKLEEEYRAKQETLEQEYAEKKEALEREYAEKIALLDSDRADFETERSRVEEELNAREAALLEAHEKQLGELNILREAQAQELAEARRVFEDELRIRREAQEIELKEVREAQESELKEAREAQEIELKEARETQESELKEAREAQESELKEAREALEVELKQAREAQENELKTVQAAQAEADETLKNELELQKQKYEEECREHARAIEALKEENAQALAEQREANEASLRVERETHARNLKELTEAHDRELKTAAETALGAADDAAAKAREEEMRTREEQLKAERERAEAVLAEEKRRHEALLSDERARYEAIIADERARHDAQIRDDRARYEEALLEHDAALRKQMELEMNEREKQIIHRNYLSLVDSPADPYQQPAQPGREEPKKAAQAEDYRSVVGKLFENAVRPTAAKPAQEADATPINSIEFRDIESRAARDGLRVSTAGSAVKAPQPADRENTVHRGKALFLSAVVVFFWCIIVGGVALGVSDKLSLPVFYPYIMWGIGLALLLVTGLAYANHFGENWLRRKVPVMVNAIVVYALLVIFDLIITLSVKADFGSVSSVMTFVGFPVIYFVGVLIFGLCYYLQTKPKK